MTAEAEKRSQINKYFAPFPKWTLGLGLVGLLTITQYGLGLLLLAAAGWFVYDWGQRPTDGQMDAWLDEDLKNLHVRALQKSGHDQTELVGEPVMITGPRLWEVGKSEIGYKKGADNILRFSPVGVTVLNFTNSQLSTYTGVLDLRTGATFNDTTEEFFYRFIVSVSTESENISVKLGEETLELKSAESFKLTNAGGGSVKVFLRAPALIEKLGGGEIPTTRAEQAISTVRRMIRERATAT